MPTLSIMASGPSLWLLSGDGFSSRIAAPFSSMFDSSGQNLLPLLLSFLFTRPLLTLSISYSQSKKKQQKTSGKSALTMCPKECYCVPIFPEAIAKALSSNFGNDKTFFLGTSCNMNPLLVYFLKTERTIRPWGQSQAATGLIVLLNRSIITIRLRLPTETNYSREFQEKGKTQRKEPWRKWTQISDLPNGNLWFLQIVIWILLFAIQSNAFW